MRARPRRVSRPFHGAVTAQKARFGLPYDLSGRSAHACSYRRPSARRARDRLPNRPSRSSSTTPGWPITHASDTVDDRRPAFTGLAFGARTSLRCTTWPYGMSSSSVNGRTNRPSPVAIPRRNSACWSIAPNVSNPCARGDHGRNPKVRDAHRHRRLCILSPI